MIRLFTVLLIFVTSGPILAEGRTVNCRLLAFGSATTGTIKARASGPDDSWIDCTIRTTTISKPASFTATDNTIRLVAAEDETELAEVSIPPAVKNALIVLFASGKDKETSAIKWRPFVIDDSSKTYPPGGAFITNLVTEPIRFIVGEHKGMLKPGQSHGYKMPTKRNTFNMAPVVFEFQKDGDWVKANESELRFLPGVRYLMFAYVAPNGGRPRIKTFQDNTEPPAVPQ